MSMKCSCCTEQCNILERRVLKRNVERRAFVLTDQHFIASAPATTPGEQCLKIIRVENATLWDLLNTFKELIGERDLGVPVGSVILLGSASHLASVGTAVYAEELVLVFRSLYQLLEGEVYILHSPFMLIDSSSNAALLLAIFEVAAWLKNVMGNDSCCLRTTMDVMLTTLIGNSTGNLIVASPTQLMLPSGLYSTDRTRWDSGGTNLPSGVRPMSRRDEGGILLNLISELNQTRSMNLDPSQNFSRQVPQRQSHQHSWLWVPVMLPKLLMPLSVLVKPSCVQQSLDGNAPSRRHQ